MPGARGLCWVAATTAETRCVDPLGRQGALGQAGGAWTGEAPTGFPVLWWQEQAAPRGVLNVEAGLRDNRF